MAHIHKPHSLQSSGGCSHGGSHSDHTGMVKDFKRRFYVSLLLTIPVLLLSPMIQGFLGIENIVHFYGNSVVLFFLSSVIYFYGGWPFLKGLWQEVADGNPGMMTLIGVAISTAFVYSGAIVVGLKGKMFFWELVTLIDIMLLGHWIEMRSVMGAGRALEELASLIPDIAHMLVRDGSVKDVPVSELKRGDRLLVKPGEKVPADGVIFKGKTSVNEAMLTGESNPIEKEEGMEVIGGSINGDASLSIEVRKTGEETFLSGVIRLVQEAQASKSKTQDLANKAAFWLTIIALSGGAVTFFVWLVFTSKDFSFAMERTVTVMVITCPHALGLAVPLVVAVSTAIAARNGLLIRNRVAFEKARNIQAIIFDKTGTLTQGEFGVTDIIVFDEKYRDEDVLSYAASIEQDSEHPIAKGIVSRAEGKWKVEGFKAIPGKGAEGMVKGERISVVSPGYLRECKISIDDSVIQVLSGQGKTVVFVMIKEKVVGAIALADIIRSESKEAIAQLKDMGVRCIMLTGDNMKVAEWVGQQIGLDEVFAEVLPDEKALKIKEVQARGLITAMIGDGVNDAPALAQADVGIAIGAGTDVAIETADIILVKSNPLDVVAIIALAQNTYNKMIQNLIWATGYNVVTIPIAAGVFYMWGFVLSPAVGALFMSFSTVVCAVNAKLLKLNR